MRSASNRGRWTTVLCALVIQFACAAAAVPLTIVLIDANGVPVGDPSTTFRLKGPQEWTASDLQVTPEGVTFEHPTSMGLEQQFTLYVEPTLYYPTKTTFRANDASDPLDIDVVVLLNRDHFDYRFAAWDELPTSAAHLKTLLATSSEIWLKDDAEDEGFRLLGALGAEQYDNGSISAATKAGLLNVYAKLRMTKAPGRGRPWSDFLEQIILVDQERILAYISDQGARLVKRLYDNADTLDVRRQASDAHFDNLPPLLRSRFAKRRIRSIKTNEHYGNLQLTLIPGEIDGAPVYILDADIDPEGGLLPHILDTLDGEPTDPRVVHEHLLLDDGSV